MTPQRSLEVTGKRVKKKLGRGYTSYKILQPNGFNNNYSCSCTLFIDCV